MVKKIMRKMLRNNRAITPVLSNVLLMLIAVAGMSIAITATYVITGNLKETMGERFVVEDVWFRTGPPGLIAIYVRNTGKMSMNLVAVYLNHEAKSFTSLALGQTEHGWLNVTYSWTVNTLYHINIVTSRGTQVADYYRSPT